MSENMIFGIPIEEIDRQLSMNPVSCDKNVPINAGEFLEPCMRGGRKVLADKKKRQMIKKIYRR